MLCTLTGLTGQGVSWMHAGHDVIGRQVARCGQCSAHTCPTSVCLLPH